MCMSPKVPAPPPPPAQRQATKAPEIKSRTGDAYGLRRRGYAALLSKSPPSLQPAMTTASLFGYGGST